MVQQAIAPPLVRGQWVPMSYEEFLAWAPEGMRTEWTDGEGIIYVSTSDRHQAIVLLVASTLETFVRLFSLGRVSFAPYPTKLWADGPHREPDLIFVAAGRLDGWTTTRFHGPPDFALEVLSEDTAGEDQDRKRRQYEAAGVQEYLMIDARPNRNEFVYLQLDTGGRYQAVAPDDQGRYHSLVLPDFWFDPAWFGQEPLPHPMALLRRVSPEGWRRLVVEIEAAG